MRLQLFSLLVFPLLALASSDEQMVFSQGTSEPYQPLTHSGDPTLADLLTIENSASIFYSYARELELSRLFLDESSRTTLLVPTNKAIMALARKPHQGSSPPASGGVIISEQEFDRLSKSNVERWISAHIIPWSPISLLSPNTYETLLEGRNITFERVDGGDASEPEWARVQLDDGTRITGMKEACNGVMYIIDGTVKAD